MRRLLSRYRKKGVSGVIHGNRGRRPSNALEKREAKQILKLAKTLYRGVNQQHFSELLAEREKDYRFALSAAPVVGERRDSEPT